MTTISFIIFYLTFFSVYSSVFSQNTDSVQNDMNTKKLTERFLWDHYFSLSENHDSLYGPRFVLEPGLYYYPLFDYHNLDTRVFDILPIEYDPRNFADSFSIEIPEKLRSQIISADEVDNPYRMATAIYCLLSPLIPTPIDNHYLFFSHRSFFGAYKLTGYIINFENGVFETMSEKLLQERYDYWPVSIKFPLYFFSESDCITIIENETLIADEITPTQLEYLIDSYAERFMLPILNPILTLEDYCTPESTFFSAINFLNHGNSRLNFWMVRLLNNRHPDLEYKSFSWSIPPGKYTNDERVIFLERLTWIFDLNWFRFDCLYRGPQDVSNVSISDIYLSENGNINIIIEVNYSGNRCRMRPSQVYFLTLGYDSYLEKFFIIDEELISGNAKYFFIKEN